MKLDENYSIDNDTNQWILNYKHTGDINPKTNKPTISTNKWYCGNLQGCLKRYLDESLKPSESIEQLQDKLYVIIARIDIAVEQLKIKETVD